MKKRGISLIVLVITMIVMTILSFVIVMSVEDYTKSAKLATFEEELREIGDGVQAYYLKNGKYPIVEGVVYTKADLLNISQDSQELQNEININNDISNEYYKIDLEKVSENTSLYGKEKYENDFYVLSVSSNIVYYPLGIYIGDEVYFSLTSKMGNINREQVNNNNLGDVSSVNGVTKIAVTNDKTGWTNEFNLTVNTTLNGGEKLYYTIDSIKTEITDKLPCVVELNYDILLKKSTLLLDAMAKHYDIIFTKEDSSGKIIAQTKVTTSNLDIFSPDAGTPVVEKFSEYTLVTFANATDAESGIDKSYYTTDTTSFDAAKLISEGKKGGTHSIKLDTTATYLQYIVVDKAGNYSLVKSINID